LPRSTWLGAAPAELQKNSGKIHKNE